MSTHLENLKTAFAGLKGLEEDQIDGFNKIIKALESEVEIINFKLKRTETIKRTTAILLEETIEELEQKRKDVEDSRNALQKSLEELKATQAQLIQSEKMSSLGELTAGIAHEIQNPLNFVNNFSELSEELVDEIKEELESGNTEEVFKIIEDLKSNLEKINHHGRRASSIVKAMLDHSRASSDTKVETDINLLCDEYLRLSYHGLKAKNKSFNASYETHFDENITKIRVVPQDIGRVILNLINNAFYAVNTKKDESQEGYVPKVTITTNTDSNGTKIIVEDNGNGIPQDVIDKIFQPFFTTKPTGQGTGLGLSLAYDIVKAHGGELSVESEVGEGTVFTIEIPNSKHQIPIEPALRSGVWELVLA